MLRVSFFSTLRGFSRIYPKQPTTMQKALSRIPRQGSFFIPGKPNQKPSIEFTCEEKPFKVPPLEIFRTVFFSQENIANQCAREVKKAVAIGDIKGLLDLRNNAVRSKAFTKEEINIYIKAALNEVLEDASPRELENFARLLGELIGVMDQKEMGELAKVVARCDSNFLVDHISDFGITDPKILGEIVIKMDKSFFRDFILNSGLKDQKDLGELAKVIANKFPAFSAKNILIFRITDQQVLGELAKLLVQGAFHQVAEKIHIFGITDQQVLGELARVVAQKDPEVFLRYIDNFWITEKELGEIAKIIGVEKPLLLVSNIDRFEFTDQEVLGEVAMKISPRYLDDFIKNTGFKDQESLVQLSKYFILKDPQYFIKALPYLSLRRKSFPELIGLYAEKISDDPKIHQIFNRIGRFRNSAIIIELMTLFSREVESPSYMGVFTELARNTSNATKGTHLPFVASKILPSIYLSLWAAKAEDGAFFDGKESCSAFFSTKAIKKQLENEIKYSLTQNMLLACGSIDKDPSLNAEQKFALMAKVFRELVKKPEEASSCFSLLFNIGSKGEGITVLEGWNEGTLEELSDLLLNIIIRDSYVDLRGIEHLNEKYERTFGSSSIPFSLSTYSSRLEIRKDPRVLKDLTRFVHLTLEGEKAFKEERYLTDKNPTLKRLKRFPKVLEGWKENLPAIKEGSLIVQEIDTPLELFEIPTMVSKNCLNLTGHPDYNKCHLSNCLDGDIKMIVVKDENFVAEGVMRIIFDVEGLPVILLEPMYASLDSPKLSLQLFNKIAEEKARELGIPLFRRNPNSPLHFNNPFTYLGGSCHSTYSDLMGGVLPGVKTRMSILNLEKVDLTRKQR